MFNLNNQRKLIFCISLQRNGTTSVGDFFRKFKFNVAGYKFTRDNNWTQSWYCGDYEKIFKSKDFKNHQVFEDDPWWATDFYKYLFFRFPNAKFILITRDQDKWFNSMLSHSEGMTLGNTQIHCKIYGREIEFEEYKRKNGILKTDIFPVDNLLSLDGKKEHYLKKYNLHNGEVLEFFNTYGKERLFHCNLEDPKKWIKLGDFFNLEVSENFEVHSNKSN